MVFTFFLGQWEASKGVGKALKSDWKLLRYLRSREAGPVADSDTAKGVKEGEGCRRKGNGVVCSCKSGAFSQGSENLMLLRGFGDAKEVR